MKAVFQVSRAATAAALVVSAVLATTVTGGVLRTTILAAPGPATLTISMAMRAGPTAFCLAVFLFVASGINLFDCLIIP